MRGGGKGPLEDVDINVVAQRESCWPSWAAKQSTPGLVAQIDGLALGESCKTGLGGPGERYVVLEADWYEFRSQVGLLGGSLEFVVRTRVGTAVLVCNTACQPRGTWHWARIRLGRRARIEELALPAARLLSADPRTAVVPTIRAWELQQLARRQPGLLTCVWGDLPAHAELGPTELPALPAVSSRDRVRASAAQLQTLELQLTKTEVTYAIGRAGARIEATRVASQATIKVLPIEQHGPAAAQRQTLAVTGNAHERAAALALLDAQLACHRLAARGHR